MLRDRGVVPEAFFAAIFNEVTDALPWLAPGEALTTEDLCGPELWSTFHGIALRRCAGMCLSYLVETGTVPLVLATPPRRYPLKFRLP